MAKYYKCDFNHNCFNCPHSDCIDGKPVVKQKTVNQQVNEIINKKYNVSEAAIKKKRERSLNWKHNHKEEVYAVNKIYAEKHPELKKFISRKYARIQILKNGGAKVVGTARVNGKETIIYGHRYRGKNQYWYMFGNTYGELTEDEIKWLWIEKAVI